MTNSDNLLCRKLSTTPLAEGETRLFHGQQFVGDNTHRSRVTGSASLTAIEAIERLARVAGYFATEARQSLENKGVPSSYGLEVIANSLSQVSLSIRGVMLLLVDRQYNPVPLLFSTAISDSVNSLMSLYPERKISFSLDEVCKQAYFLGDKHMIVSAILVFLANAIDATEGVSSDRATINITTGIFRKEDGTGEYVYCSVEDKGTGIDPVIFEKISEPYITDKRGRTGFGLFQAKTMISQHGGYIEIASEKGRGTKVAFYIPRLEIEV